MRIYTGTPRQRFGYAHEQWVQVPSDTGGRHHVRELPAIVHQEVKRIWGISIGGWFFGVQRVEFKK